MFKEFQDFIKKGNVLQMAVGLIMALYFGVITKSFVDDILMPPLGLIIGGVDFSTLKIVLQDGVAAVMEGDTVVVEAVKEVSINYGTFINTIITFVIVAFAVFMLVKAYNKMEKKEEAAPAAPPAPSKEEVLLAEIRDELRKRN
ncbi:large-conductance mechanosensitive channel protein MscL [Vicingaceae bacterium]|nr:large-conductance mechanosensitive channel protein MscL [Vicingaceae bacterium]